MYHTHDDFAEGTHDHDGYEHSHIVRVDGTHVVQVGDRVYKQPKHPPAAGAQSVTLEVQGVTVTPNTTWSR